MPGYLLDSNHVNALFLKKPLVRARAAAVADSQLRACVITLGEIEAGHRRNKTTNQARRDEFSAWVNQKFLANAIEITAKTRTYYAEISARLFEAHPKTTKHQKTERHLVADLGIDINDLWIASVALEHGLTLVTNDGMEKIAEVIEKLGVKVEDWMVPPKLKLQQGDSQRKV